jgi:hypothetical protein
MRTYKTVGVHASPTHAIYGGTPFKAQTFRDDDIIIMYAVWNLIMKSSLQHELLVSWVRQEAGRVKCVILDG